MDAIERERERCISIMRDEMEGATVDTRRVLVRIINRIRREAKPAEDID